VSGFPLSRLLKGKLLRIAETQDAVITYLISRGVEFVLHGGTAVWRIYGGKRVSIDIDVYAENPMGVVDVLKENFRVEKARVTPAGVVYARVLGNERVEVDVTPLPSALERVEGDYRLVDGGTIVVWTLAPEALLLEKARAYVERCKARDLYDVYYLLDLCRPEFSAEVSRMLLERLCEPSDMDALRELVLVGLPPSFPAFRRKVEKYAAAKV